MFQDVARSGTILVPVGSGATSRLYRFWASQMDSFTEFCAGSSVSTFTALARISVLTALVAPGAALLLLLLLLFGLVDELLPEVQAATSEQAARDIPRATVRRRRRGTDEGRAAVMGVSLQRWPAPEAGTSRDRGGRRRSARDRDAWRAAGRRGTRP